MSNDINKKQLPEDATIEYSGYNYDGDRAPLSVTYNTNAGPRRTVKVKQTQDGDYIPETGYTPDGDFHLPDKKINWLDP
jgi:hypothetical protein